MTGTDPLVTELQLRRDAALDAARQLSQRCGPSDPGGQNDAAMMTHLYTAECAVRYLELIAKEGR